MDKNSISEAEWEVMKVLWRAPDSTLSQIRENLQFTQWSASTIKTLLSRLVKKQCVAVDQRQANSFSYKAAISEHECKVLEVKNFLQRVFDGSASLFVSTLVKESKMSKKEQDEILSMIRNMKESD